MTSALVASVPKPFVSFNIYLQNLVSDKAHGFNRVDENENFKM